MLAKTVLAMLSTFDSTEARVGVMVAGVELQQKLLHRLRILGEAPQAETPAPDVHKKASPCNSLRDEDRLAALSAEEKRLRQQILKYKKQSQQALARKLKEEAEVCKAQKASLVVVAAV